MISYDSYKNKIEKVARAKEFVVKYKFLIIGVLALLIGGISALLAMKGTVTAAMVIPEQVVYGEEYSPSSATAFLSGVEYEYALQSGGEWTAKKPLKAGKYYARTVTNKTIGKGYGEPVAFEILPKDSEFTFGSGEVLKYGNDPSGYLLDGLVTGYGDRISGVDFDYIYNDTGAESEWTAEVAVRAGSLKIVDSNGEDSSACYNYEEVKKTFKLLKRDISVSLKNASGTYCGEEIEYIGEIDVKTQNLLVSGDTISADTVITRNGAPAKILNAGEYAIEFVDPSDIKITDEAGNDITHRYDITTVTGARYTLNKKPVTITTDSARKVYDGNRLSADGATAPELVSGHNLAAQGAAVWVIDKTAGTMNERVYEISDAAGNDVTENYIINYRYGNLVIDPRTLNYSVGSATKKYDGTPLIPFVVNFDKTQLAAGDRERIVSIAEITDVWESGREAFVNVEIYNSDGALVTGNYEINKKFGTLTITPLDIEIKTADDEWTYDGKPHSAPAGTVVNGSLVSGHKLKVDTIYSITSVSQNAPANNATTFDIVDDGGKSLGGNYKITYVNGTLKIKKRDLGIKSATHTWTYDGNVHFDNGYTVTDGSLASGQSVVVSDSTRVTDAVDGEINKLIYSVSAGGADVSENYNFLEPVWGTLTVLKRGVTIKLNDVKSVYGETPVYMGGNEAQNLASGHSVSVKNVTFKPATPDIGVYVGAVICTNADLNIYDANGKEVTKNYNVVSLTHGTLTVSKRILVVELNDISVVYGDAIAYPEAEGNYKYITSDYKLVSGHTLTVKKVNFGFGKLIPDKGDYTFVGEEYFIKDIGGKDVTANYSVTSSGLLTIERRKITVKSSDGEWDYTGEVRYNEKYLITDGSKVPGQEIKVFSYTEVCDYTAGTPNKQVYAIKNGTQDVTANYEITAIWGTLKIFKIKLTVALNDLTVTYGDTVFYPDGEGNYKDITSAATLVNNEKFTALNIKYSFTSAMPDAGKYKIGAGGYKVTKLDGSDSTPNYDVTFADGTLTVEKRNITITSGSQTWEYDGKVHFDEDYGITSGSLASGQRVQVTSNTKVTAVCDKVENKLGFEILNGAGDRVTANYNIATVWGELTVLVRNITVELGMVNATYGNESYIYNGGEKVINNADGHRVVVDGSKVKVTVSPQPNAGDYLGAVTCESGDIKVLNADGEDVTASFNVTVKGGALNVAKKDVTVKLFEVENKEYDGLPLIYSAGIGNYAFAEGLVYGQLLEVEAEWNKRPVDAGAYTASYKSGKIYSSGGAEIAGGINNYIVTCNKITTTIYPKELSVKLSSFTGADAALYYAIAFEYPSVFDNYAVADSTPTANGEHIQISVKFKNAAGREVQPIAAGEYEIIFDSIVDASSSVHNYKVTSFESGKLEIKKRDISVKAEDEKYVFGDTINHRKTPVLTSGTIIFGQDVVIDGCAYIDLATGEELFFISEVGTYKIIPVIVQVIENGLDVSANYNITKDDGGRLEIMQRKIRLETASQTWTYDGKEHSNINFTMWLIDDGRQLTLPASEYEMILNTAVGAAAQYAGRYKNKVDYDFTGSNYTPEEYVWGTLEITPARLTVSTEDATREYNGEPLFKHEATVTGFVDGDEEYCTLSNFHEITDAGYIKNSCSLLLPDDVAKNYRIVMTQFGTLTVLPRPIIVKTGSDKWVYDGTNHFVDTYLTYYDGNRAEEGLLGTDGITLKVDYLRKVLSVCYVYNDTTFIPVLGATASNNYKIVSYDCGTLEITPKPVTVYLSDREVPYGSQYPSHFGNYDTENTVGIVAGDSLKVGVNYKTSAGEISEIARNAGVYTVLGVENECYVESANLKTNAAYNYEFNFVDGKLTVVPKVISVGLLNYDNEVYGEKFAGYKTGVNNFYNPSDTMEFGETLEVTVKYLTADGVEFIPEARTPAGLYRIAVNGYVIRSDNGEIIYDSAVDGLTGNAGNYIVDGITGGTLTVHRRGLQIRLKGLKKEYDGISISLSEYEKVYWSLGGEYSVGIIDGDGEVLKLIDGTANSILNVGKVLNGAKYGLDVDNPASANYEISGYDKVYLEVYAREITIGLKSIESGIYTGQSFEYPSGADNFDLLSGEFVAGESLTVFVLFRSADKGVAAPKNAGAYIYSFDYLLSYVSGSVGGLENGIYNYNVICLNSGRFEIFKRELKVTLDEMTSSVYDGNIREHSRGYSVEGEFAEGESLSPSVTYYYMDDGAMIPLGGLPQNAGKYAVELSVENSFIGGEFADVNYDIESNVVTFEIFKKSLTVAAGDESREYNGSAYNYAVEGERLSAEGLVDGERVNVTYVAYFKGGAPVTGAKNAGEYSAEILSYEILNRFGGGSTDNYEVTSFDSGFKLTITKKSASAEVMDMTYERQLTPQSPYTIENVTLTGFVEGDALDYEFIYTDADGKTLSEVYDFGEYKVTIAFKESTTENYSIDVKEGTLKVVSRRVAVQATYGGAGNPVYNGNALDLSPFGFKHWHATDETMTEAGFLDGYENTLNPVYMFEKGGVKYTAPTDAGEYTVTVEFNPAVPVELYNIESKEFKFTIAPRPVKVTVNVPRVNLTYSHTLLQNLIGDDITTAMEVSDNFGILEKDKGEYLIYTYFDHRTRGVVRLDFAGEYDVKVRLNKEGGNYVLDEDECVWGEFEVKPVTMYLAPVDRVVDYTNSAAVYDFDNYTILQGSLVTGDIITLSALKPLSAPRVSSTSGIASVKVDSADGDVTDCYDLHYAYDSEDDVIIANGWIKSTFTARISFNVREVRYTINPSAIPADKRVHLYTGNALSFEDLGITNISDFITVLDSPVDGDSFEWMVSGLKTPKVYKLKEWLQPVVYGPGGKATGLYKFIPTIESTVDITIEKRTLDFAFTTSEDELSASFDSLENSQYDGYKVLSADKYSLSGSGLLDGQETEVLVSKDADGNITVQVIVFELRGDRRTDKFDFYSITGKIGNITVGSARISDIKN